MNAFLYVPLLLLFSAAAFSDLAEGKIPNRLIGFGFVSFLCCAVVSTVHSCFFGEGTEIQTALCSHGIPSVTAAVLSAAICLGLPVLWKLRLLGGGDVKLFWLLFLFLPGVPGIICFFLSFLFAFPAALYGWYLGTRKIRLGGAVFLAVLVFAGREAGVL